MKHILLSFLISLASMAPSFSQAPDAFNYQGIARDNSGNPLNSTSIGIRVSVLTGSAAGTAEYTETHSVVTNSFGLFNLEIGNGTPTTGTFAAITWGSATKFLKIEIDPAGGTSYTLTGTSQILSVPYAMYAATSGNASANGIGLGGTANLSSFQNSYSSIISLPEAEYLGTATDASGNIYLTGTFAGSATFGAYTLNATSARSFFIVKINASGTVLWAQSSGGTATVNMYNNNNPIAVDASGNCYIGGYVAYSSGGSTLIVGSTTLTVQDFHSNFFLTKYDSNGNPQWMVSADPSSTCYNMQASAVAVDGSGNPYITGTFSNGDLILSGTTINNSSSSYYKIFLAKYNSAGVFQWVRTTNSEPSNYGDTGTSLVTDIAGNCYLAGTLNNSTIDFSGNVLTNNGGADVFIVKYTSAGNVSWAKNFGGSDEEYASRITTDSVGNIYITGSMESSSLTLGSGTIVNIGSEDIFLVKIDPSGNYVYAKNLGGSNYDSGQDVKVFNSKVYVGGYYYDNLVSGTTITKSLSGTDTPVVATFDASGTLVNTMDIKLFAAAELVSVIKGNSNSLMYILDVSGPFYNNGTLQNPGVYIIKP